MPRVVDLAQKILIRFIKFCQYVEFCYYMYLAPHPPPPPNLRWTWYFVYANKISLRPKRTWAKFGWYWTFFCMLTLSFKGPSIYMSFLQPKRLCANFGLSWLKSLGKSRIFIISPCKKAWSFTVSWIPLSKNIWCQVWLKMALVILLTK